MRMLLFLCAYLCGPIQKIAMPISTREQVQRREVLRELLQRGPASTQKTLVQALSAKGLHATQSSVSRDLHELGAVKTGQGYQLPGLMDAQDEMNKVAEFVRDILPAGPHLTVVKTAIGAAQRVALALDRSAWPEIIGNIGGDDTVFVATESAAAQKLLIAKLERTRHWRRAL
jgi:transcriptional regulator of arginine metabolism